MESPPFPLLRRFGLSGELGDVGCALFEFRGSLRFVQAARASCAVAQFACQPEGTRRAAQRGALFFRLFSFGQAKEMDPQPGGPGIKQPESEQSHVA
ncbi:MAG: hypothetical protein ABIG70_08885 [Pseudomonadota bacterium]